VVKGLSTGRATGLCFAGSAVTGRRAGPAGAGVGRPGTEGGVRPTFSEPEDDRSDR
jgi:hypothetical protein